MTTPIEVPYRTRVASLDLFEKRYDPMIKPDGSLLFNWHEVNKLDNSYVWTVVEAEGKLYAMPGYHTVNRIGYLIAQKPWGVIESLCKGYRYA